MSSTFRIETADGTERMGVLRIHGDLDPRSAPLLVAQCRRYALEGRGLVLNLAGITFLSSSGIGALLALFEEFRQKNRNLKLAELSSPAESVIRLLNLDQFLVLEKTEQDALEDNEAA
jgi:anti-anti-sigma factor